MREVENVPPTSNDLRALPQAAKRRLMPLLECSFFYIANWWWTGKGSIISYEWPQRGLDAEVSLWEGCIFFVFFADTSLTCVRAADLFPVALISIPDDNSKWFYHCSSAWLGLLVRPSILRVADFSLLVLYFYDLPPFCENLSKWLISGAKYVSCGSSCSWWELVVSFTCIVILASGQPFY